jgi:hypothetical protein
MRAFEQVISPHFALLDFQQSSDTITVSRFDSSGTSTGQFSHALSSDQH